jgi:integrase
MARKRLTERTLKTLKPAQPGKLYDVADEVARGLAVRVSDTGRCTFVMVARFPGSKNPTRRRLGEYPSMTLEEARARAEEWRRLIQRGVDPAVAEQQERLAAARRQQITFAAVVADFAEDKLKHERRGWAVRREIEREFLPAWGSTPIADITPLDVLTVIRAKKATAPAMARNLLGTAKRLFQWAVDQHAYGLEKSPVADLKPTSLLGEKTVGDRTLSDDELFAFWRITSRMRYPAGPAYRLLLLTGLRLNEVADASWPEFNRREGIWVIPAERMKGRPNRARPHAVPLTKDIAAILDKLPRFNRGKHLFSTTFGETPVWLGDKLKKRLDTRMLRTLRALAKKRGDNPDDVELKPWRVHDIRRTVRTRLSRLKISEEAREAVLAHVRPGIKGVYDTHDYLAEKAEALTLWAAALRKIVEPPPPAATVLRLRGRA